MYLEKTIESLGLLLGLVGAILIGRTKWTVGGTFAEHSMWRGIHGEARGSIEGLTYEPANAGEWRWGWRLMWGGFGLQFIAVWLGIALAALH